MNRRESPLVSICVITYNHLPYIRQCLDSLLLQKTDFAYEVIINDDCSTDGTDNIIKEYALKYPGIIHPIFHNENLYSKGICGMLAKFCFPKASGRYIALCDGDDYWTDSLKLQKQVTFLEQNPSFSFCCHAFAETGDTAVDWANKKSETITLENFIKGDCTLLTSTLTFRRSSLVVSNYYKYNRQRDILLYYALLSQGNGYYLKDSMAIYRKHSGGIWSLCDTPTKWSMSFNNILDILEYEKDRNASLYMYRFLLQRTGRKALNPHKWKLLKALVIIAQKLGLRYAFNALSSLLFHTSPRFEINEEF